MVLGASTRWSSGGGLLPEGEVSMSDRRRPRISALLVCLENWREDPDCETARYLLADALLDYWQLDLVLNREAHPLYQKRLKAGDVGVWPLGVEG